MLTETVLIDLLEKIKQVRIALLGDLFVDMYWEADMKLSILSRETPHHPLPVVEERIAPGGGANAAVNLKDLGAAQMQLCGVIGNDWRGYALIREFLAREIAIDHVVQSGEMTTNAYCKPIRTGISDVVYEDPRIDFENRSPLPARAEDSIIQWLQDLPGTVDALCVNDQAAFGCVTPRVLRTLN